MAGLTTSKDVLKTVAIDFNNRLVESVQPLLDILGITNLSTLRAGTVIKQYKITGTLESGSVTEGENVPESKYAQQAVKTIEAQIKKYRRGTTEEAILKSGLEDAVAKTDDTFMLDIAAEIRKDFVTFLGTGTGTAKNGKDLKATLSYLRGALAAEALEKGYNGVSTIFFVNPSDVYDYLADSSIYHVETAFGMQYIKDFLGLGTVFFANVEEGEVYATFIENINGYAVDIEALNDAGFNYTIDDTGIIGISHDDTRTENGKVFTDVRTGLQFVPEYVNLIYKAEIEPTV